MSHDKYPALKISAKTKYNKYNLKNNTVILWTVYSFNDSIALNMFEFACWWETEVGPEDTCYTNELRLCWN